MHIDHYSFGNITVKGTSYSSDVIIFPDRVKSSWWRLEGHLLQVDDLKDVLAARVPILIVGTGYYGAMKVPGKTIEYLKSRDMEVHIKKTGDAVKFYNDISFRKPVIAVLHLTC
jgi:hypothetical protein